MKKTHSPYHKVSSVLQTLTRVNAKRMSMLEVGPFIGSVAVITFTSTSTFTINYFFVTYSPTAP